MAYSLCIDVQAYQVQLSEAIADVEQGFDSVRYVVGWQI